MMIRRKRMGGVSMIICFFTGNKKDAAYQGSPGKPEAHVRVLGRCFGGCTEAPLLPQEMTGQPARCHDPGPAPVLLAAVPGDIGLAQSLVTMNCKESEAPRCPNCTVRWPSAGAIHFLPGRVDSLM